MSSIIFLCCVPAFAFTTNAGNISVLSELSAIIAPMVKHTIRKTVVGIGILIIFVVYSLVIREKAPVLSKSVPSVGLPMASSGSAVPASAGNKTANNSHYKDGRYTGNVADAYYGNVQISVTITGGQITDLAFLQYPDTHQTSVIINQQAIPDLKQEAIQSQSANVQIISGATYTSQAFQQSLQSALDQA